MKNDTLQQLLAKYQEGSLSQAELEQLNVLTHKDEVLGAAVGRARTIVVRRTMRNVAFAVVGLAVIGAGIWAIIPSAESPMVAEHEVNTQTVVESVAEIQHTEAPAVEDVTLVAEKKTPKAQVLRHTNVVNDEMERVVPAEMQEEPTVVCNNQCDADSVINDIWKFLTA